MGSAWIEPEPARSVEHRRQPLTGTAASTCNACAAPARSHPPGRQGGKQSKHSQRVSLGAVDQQRVCVCHRYQWYSGMVSHETQGSACTPQRRQGVGISCWQATMANSGSKCTSAQQAVHEYSRQQPQQPSHDTHPQPPQPRSRVELREASQHGEMGGKECGHMCSQQRLTCGPCERCAVCCGGGSPKLVNQDQAGRAGLIQDVGHLLYAAIMQSNVQVNAVPFPHTPSPAPPFPCRDEQAMDAAVHLKMWVSTAPGNKCCELTTHLHFHHECRGIRLDRVSSAHACEDGVQGPQCHGLCRHVRTTLRQHHQQPHLLQVRALTSLCSSSTLKIWMEAARCQQPVMLGHMDVDDSTCSS